MYPTFSTEYIFEMFHIIMYVEVSSVFILTAAEYPILWMSQIIHLVLYQCGHVVFGIWCLFELSFQRGRGNKSQPTEAGGMIV